MRVIRFTELWKKYRFAALIVLAGVVLMLLPTRRSTASAAEKGVSSAEESFSLSRTEERMEAILGQMEGVGKLRVMLTLAEGPRLLLASDSDVSTEAGGGVTRSRLEPLTVNRGSGTQEVVVTHQLYPVYLGAMVVCQGADSSAVRLAVTEAVAALTGLSSDRISVVKWKQS